MWLGTSTLIIQTVAASVQALFAILIWLATRRYVRLTDEIVRLQRNIVDLENQSVRRDLYDRRIKVFDATMAFLAKFVSDLKVEFEDITRLIRETRQAEFLFETDVISILDEIRTKASQHRVFRITYEQNHGQHELDNCHKIEIWFIEAAFERAKNVFGRYLNLTADQPGPAPLEPKGE